MIIKNVSKNSERKRKTHGKLWELILSAKIPKQINYLHADNGVYEK